MRGKKRFPEEPEQDTAEAELARIVNETLLDELLNTKEPTAEGKALLEEMRRDLAKRMIARR